MLKKWWNTPWTWGTYVKMTIGSVVAAMGYWAVVMLWLKSQTKKYYKNDAWDTQEECDG